MSEEFEFYRDLNKDRFKEVNLPATESYDPFDLNSNFELLSANAQNMKNNTQYVEIKKIKADRHKRVAETKTRSRRAKAKVLALLVVAGFGVHAVVNYVVPLVDNVVTYQKNETMISDMMDYYMKNDGYLKTLDLVYEEQSFLDTSPAQIDLTDPKNVRVNDKGEMVGPAKDLFDDFDSYVATHNDGVGYYETTKIDNDIARKLGIRPQNAGVLTPEQLDEMFEKHESKTLGGM